MNRIAYIIPTHDRPEVLARTLRALGALPCHNAEVVLIDNASNLPVADQVRDGLGGVDHGELPNGIQVHVIRSDANLGASGRNLAVEASDPSCRWVVMLDDDSWPLDLGHLDAIADASAPTPSGLRADEPEVGAIAGEILLTSGEREAGGLPEVFTGCGAIIRRDVFLELDGGGNERSGGGYDPAFGYYAEEYDFAARLILAGLRVVTDRRARFMHAKVQAGRDMDRILARLVRNNGWVMQRYAPEGGGVRRAEVRRVVDRYGEIAEKEHATRGFQTGLGELLRSIRSQRRRPLKPRQWDRFTGKAACRRALLRAWGGAGLDQASVGQGAGVGGVQGFASAAIVDARGQVVPGGVGGGGGKNVHIIREVLDELGVRLVADTFRADVLVIGTLSPGPMWDAMERLQPQHHGAPGSMRILPPVIAAWTATSWPVIIPGQRKASVRMGPGARSPSPSALGEQRCA